VFFGLAETDGGRFFLSLFAFVGRVGTAAWLFAKDVVQDVVNLADDNVGEAGATKSVVAVYGGRGIVRF